MPDDPIAQRQFHDDALQQSIIQQETEQQNFVKKKENGRKIDNRLRSMYDFNCACYGIHCKAI